MLLPVGVRLTVQVHNNFSKRQEIIAFYLDFRCNLRCGGITTRFAHDYNWYRSFIEYRRRYFIVCWEWVRKRCSIKSNFTRLEENGVALNLRKCLFSKHKLEFYGYVFTEQGMKPSEHKLKAIRDTTRPEDQKAVRSFLWLTKYLKSFIHDYSWKTFQLATSTLKEGYSFCMDWRIRKCLPTI